MWHCVNDVITDDVFIIKDANAAKQLSYYFVQSSVREVKC